MNASNDLNTNALREHRENERKTLERVQAEATQPERHPEGGRIRGKLSVRW